MKLHGREIKVGDKVWSIHGGWLNVEEINKGNDCPIITDDSLSHTCDGKSLFSSAFPRLFWNELTFNPADIEPPKAKRKLYLWAYEVSGKWFPGKVFAETPDMFRTEAHLHDETEVRRLPKTEIEVD